MLDHRSQDAEQNKDADDHDIQTVGQEKLLYVEGVFIVFPVLLPLFSAGEVREPEQIDQVITIGKGIMSPVFDFLKGGVMLELRIKLTVFVDVFFILDFALVLQLRQFRFMLALQFGELRFIALVLFRLFRRTGSDDLVVVFLVVVCVEIADRFINQRLDLCAVRVLHCLGFFQRFPILGDDGRLFRFGIVGVLFDNRHMVGQRDDPVGAFRPEGIDFLLNSADVLVNGRQKAPFFFGGKDRFVFRIHASVLPPIKDISR